MMSEQARDTLRVLIVEEDASIRQLLREHLSMCGFVITEAADGRDALRHGVEDDFDLIILDVMLPTVDGLTLCRTFRARGANRETPILMLTPRDSESDKVLGLESGADDYITKPFGVREFMARVTAVLRRSQARIESEPASQTRVIAIRGLVLDPQRVAAEISGRRVDLTKQEFDVLYLLASRPGIVFSRTALLARVWSGDTLVTERTVDAVVSRLRKKIERDAQNPELILTAWGAGYKFADVD